MNPLRSLFLSLSRVPPAILLTFIVGVALVVAWMVTTKISSDEQSFATKQKEIDAKYSAKSTVVYALKDVPEGQTIPSEALDERQIERSKVPEDAITSATLAVGRVTKYGISAGQLVSQHDLLAQNQATTFDQRLKPGFRAVTFAVDNNSGVAGFITPESHIDIISMVGSGADTKARPILSDIEVIAVGQTYQKAVGSSYATPASSVTVAVSTEDTTKLIKAIVASKLYLSLRNSSDHVPVATVDVTTLFHGGAAPVSHMNFGGGGAPPPPPETTELPPMPGEEGSPRALASADAPQRPAHEIESWSADRKAVIVVPER